MLLFQCEQTVLAELSELLVLKVASALRIEPSQVKVQWHLDGVKRVLGAVASAVGAASHVRGFPVPKVTLDKSLKFPDLEEGNLVPEVVRTLECRIQMETAAQLRGLRGRRPTHGA